MNLMYTLLLVPAMVVGAVVTTHDYEDEDDFSVWDPVYEVPVVSESDSVAKLLFIAGEADILGRSQIDASTISAFVRRHNPDFSTEIAEAFITIGDIYGIRGDVALCQAIIETGWFKFADGTAVTPDQHNYCGLGVTKRGVRGAAFDCIEDGVRAHLQHLYAYASTSPLPRGERKLDPRFDLVTRGVAQTWHDLSNRWAMNPNYGRQIMTLYAQLLESAPQGER